VAFSGWVDADQVLSNSAAVLNSLPGAKYLAFGGGNANGHWTVATLQKISSYCTTGNFKAYSGLAFDVEEGDSGLSSNFANAFSTCKAHGFKILVTTSHSAPYGFSDAATLMQSFFTNGNIDYLSPQLYTSGTESSNDFSTTAGVQWSSYKTASAQVIPSIVTGNLYSNAQSYFSGVGVKTGGYVQWSQTVTSAGNTPPPSSPPSSPPSGSGSTVRCGTDWTSANSGCGNTCTTNAQCPSGQSCYNALNPCSSSSSPPASPTRCGSSWDQANTICGPSCATNADCPSGSGGSCWASLSVAPCPVNAVSNNEQVFSQTTPVNEMTLTPLQIGLIVSGCCLVVFVIIAVVVVVGQKKIEERV
jgi:hypothetical protein